MRVDWCVSSWFRIKNTHSLTMESVSAGRVHAITGAILSYSSSASAPNLDPIAFKEAALARRRNEAVSFESGAVLSTRAIPYKQRQ